MRLLKGLTRLAADFIEHSGLGCPSPAVLVTRVQMELDEARQAISEGKALVADELADVIICAAVAIVLLGFKPALLVTQKHNVNLRRKWEPHPEVKGAVRHVKEPI